MKGNSRLRRWRNSASWQQQCWPWPRAPTNIPTPRSSRIRILAGGSIFYGIAYFSSERSYSFSLKRRSSMWCSVIAAGQLIPGTPPQTHGHATLEIIWTIIPAVHSAVHRRADGKDDLQTQAKAVAGCARDRGHRSPVVVGIPLSRIRHRDGERDLHPDGPHGELQDDFAGCHPLVLDSAARRKARRNCKPNQLHLVHP